MEIIRPTQKQVLATVAGKTPIIDKYIRATKARRLKGKAFQLWQIDDNEYTSVFGRSIHAASDQDEDLNEGALEMLSRWGDVGADDEVALYWWQNDYVCSVVTGRAPRTRLRVEWLNSAGTANDLSDNEMATYQEAVFTLGYDLSERMSEFQKADVDNKLIKPGREARAEGRHWLPDGNILNRNLLVGSLVYPIILPTPEEEAAEEE